jgi:hypothetical protein
MVKLFALLQSRSPIGDRSICSGSGSRRHCRGDVRIFFGGLRAAQRLGLHVEGSGAITGRLRRPGHRVEGDVDAAATATAEAGDRAGGFGTRSEAQERGLNFRVTGTPGCLGSSVALRSQAFAFSTLLPKVNRPPI